MLKIKLKQLGQNLVIIWENQAPYTIVLPKGYDFNTVFSLAYKNNEGIKIANTLLLKELRKFEKPKVVDLKIIEKRIEKKKLEKKIKSIQSFDYKTLPVFIPDEWVELIESKKDNQHLINFLMWLSLSDSEYTRNNFLKSFDAKYCYITPNGFIASLRQLWLKETNDELYDFVQSSWLKVKTIWKKSVKNYGVYFKDGKYVISTTDPDIKEKGWDFEGNLDDLKYNYLPIKKNTYESDYGKRNNSIHQEEWSVGDIITMPDKATHGAICGMRQYHILQNPLDVITEVHGKYGDTIALVLVNPARVISIEAGWKYTTDSWYFASVMDKEDVAKQFTEQWSVFEHDYLEQNIEEIKASIIATKEKTVKSDKKLKINNLKEQLKSFKVLNNKTDHLQPELYNKIIENRISLITK